MSDPVLVLPHSPLVGALTWEPVADALRADGHRVVVPSLGSAPSGPGPAPVGRCTRRRWCARWWPPARMPGRPSWWATTRHPPAGPDPRERFRADVPPVPVACLAETAPDLPDPDRTAYLQPGAAYQDQGDEAARAGRPTHRLDLHHLAPPGPAPPRAADPS